MGTEPPENGTTLRADAVGVRDLVFFVLSAAAPLTVMAGFAAIAFLVGGVVAPAGFLIAGIVFAVFAVGFTAMSRHLPGSGAFYVYIRRGLGPVTGSGAALVAYVAYALGQVGFVAVAGLFASTTLRDLLGWSAPWQVCALILGLLVALLSYLKVDIGARVLAVLLTAEVAVLLVLSVAILLRGGHEGLSFGSFDPANLLTPGLGSLFVITFVVYLGFEQTAIYSEEARDPRRTVSRATYVAVATLAVLYTFVSWVILMGAGPDRLASLLAGDPADLVFGLNTEYVGTAMTDVMHVLIVTSFFAGVLALQNAGSRYLFSLGRDGVLPAAFARTNRGQTPSTAGVTHTVVVLGVLAGFALAGLDPYRQIVAWTNTPALVGVLALEAATSIAVIRFFHRNRTGETAWQRLVAPALAAVLLAAVLVLVILRMNLLTNLGPTGNFLVLSPLVAGLLAGCGRALWLRAAGRGLVQETSTDTGTTTGTPEENHR